MVRIEEVRAVPVEGGFFFDDQAAIKAGAQRSGFGYEGDPQTPGFDRIRQPAEALSVLLTLSDGTVVEGDCAAVQYSGAGGRDPTFRASEHAGVVEGTIGDRLVGRDAGPFLKNVAILENLDQRDGPYHTAVHYGVSQALLAAAARARRTTMAEVVAEAFGTEPATEPVPVYAQTGDERRRNAEKMILKGVDVLPHGLFNAVEKIGADGGRLVEYITWLTDRIEQLGDEDYHPRIHVDVYGNLDAVFGPPFDRPELVAYFEELGEAAAPYPLQVEGPMDAGSRPAQIRAMGELRDALDDAGVIVDLVADEWCDTLEDVRAFADAGAADVVQVKTPDLGGIQNTVRAVESCEGTATRAYVGGTCAETDVSARVSAQVAVATDPCQVLAKPGMGVDEGYMIVANEMRRTLARMASRAP